MLQLIHLSGHKSENLRILRSQTVGRLCGLASILLRLILMILLYATAALFYHPGCLHREQRIYADTAKFFYDPLGGDRFGGIWEPSISKPMPFRVMNRFSSIPKTKVCLKASLVGG
jgi:hypothetical protein